HCRPPGLTNSPVFSSHYDPHSVGGTTRLGRPRERRTGADGGSRSHSFTSLPLRDEPDGTVRTGEYLSGDLPPDPAGVVRLPFLDLPVAGGPEEDVRRVPVGVLLFPPPDDDPGSRGSRQGRPAAQTTVEHAHDPKP